MGCMSSNLSAGQLDQTLNDFYTATPQRKTPTSTKRNCTSRMSEDSSGVFSRCTTPSFRKSNSKINEQQQQQPQPMATSTPKRKQHQKSQKENQQNQHNCVFNKKSYFKNTLNMMSICDDFAEAELLSPQKMQQDKSFGYFSESFSTDSAGRTTPMRTNALNTQDMSVDNDDIDTKASPSPPLSAAAAMNDISSSVPMMSDLEMEMYMMTHSPNLMPKTSSPLFERRNTTFLVASPSYDKWRQYLQNTPAYMLHNLTHLPEAIAGHFSPLDFPAFTDLENMENAAKRYKVDRQAFDLYENAQHELMPVIAKTHTTKMDL